MRMAKLSIVVPVYNIEKYLKECVDSIINQTFTDLEIILVDDGSTDSSGAICDEYAVKDKRVKVIHQENLGPAYARYAGVNAANSSYVTFVDADDWLELCAYERALAHIEEDTDMVVFGLIRYGGENYKTKELNAIKAGRYNRKEIEENVFPTMLWDIDLHGCGIDASLWSKIAKKELWLEQLVKVKELYIHYGEDVAVIYPMIMNMNNIVIMDECLYYHRLRANGEYPGYLKDAKFHEKLNQLYLYLKDNVHENPQLIRQIEYFYLHAVEMRLRIFGERRVRKTYVFPFDIVEKNSSVILYGAGTVGQAFYRQIKQIDYCNLVAWVDKNYGAYPIYNVKSPEEIGKLFAYDYIVIANASELAVKEITEWLLDRGVEAKKIIWSAKSTGGY